MTKKVRGWLIVAGTLILLGCILIGGALLMVNCDFSKLSTTKYETNEYSINEEIKNIIIKGNTADILFVPAENASVRCYERKNAKHEVKIVDGTLTIRLVDNRKWYEYIGITFGTPKITVSLPEGAYHSLSITSSTGDVVIPTDFGFRSIDVSLSTGEVTCSASADETLKLKTGTGSIRIAELTAGMLDLSVSTGKITLADVVCPGDVKVCVSTGAAELKNLQCNNLISTGSTGAIILSDVIATGKMNIERSTGDVKLERCDAAELRIVTDTGDVTGSLLTDKIIFAKSDTGRVKVPQTLTGGRCEITTDTGDISIEIH